MHFIDSVLCVPCQLYLLNASENGFIERLPLLWPGPGPGLLCIMNYGGVLCLERF